jgi:hypothetical protein
VAGALPFPPLSTVGALTSVSCQKVEMGQVKNNLNQLNRQVADLNYNSEYFNRRLDEIDPFEWSKPNYRFGQDDEYDGLGFRFPRR